MYKFDIVDGHYWKEAVAIKAGWLGLNGVERSDYLKSRAILWANFSLVYSHLPPTALVSFPIVIKYIGKSNFGGGFIWLTIPGYNP